MLFFISGLLVVSVLLNVQWYCRFKAMRKASTVEEVVPILNQQIQAGRHYDFWLNNGNRLNNMLLLGHSNASGDDFVIGGWEGMVILQHADGKKEFVKTVIIRQMREV
jgi:hypothetical protein